MNNETIRTLCLSFPKVTEEMKWESDVCFCIAGKIFCMINTNADFSVLFKCTEEDFNQLCERDGIIPAPYLARNKWVLVQKSTVLNKSEWDRFVQVSFKLVISKLPKKIKNELGLP